jgi:outer membrane protein assembly factor BamB
MHRLKWGALLCLAVVMACSDKDPGPTPDPSPPEADGGTDAGVSGSGSGDAGGPDGGTDAGPTAPIGGGDWSQYRSGPEGTWANSGTFTVAQAAGVTPLWTADAGPQGYIQPLIVGDSVYVTTGQLGKVLAFDARTGASRWTRTLDQTFTDPCLDHPLHPGFWDAPAFVNGVLYAAAPDGIVYALDPANGDTLRQSPVATVASPPELIQSSPAASTALGRLYLGVAAVFTCHHVPGRVIWVDLSTGASHSTTLTENGRVGASVWSSIAVDAPARRIYVTTGDPANQPLAEVPLAQSIVALQADTLEVLDHWQDPGPGPGDNSDFGASPTLFTAADGTPLVGSVNKDGWLYVLKRERLSDGPLWMYRLAVGGQDPLKGQGSLVAPTFANGLLYAAGGVTPEGEPGAVVALDPLTGALRWKHKTPGFVFAGMPALGEVLVVVSNSLDGKKSWLELLDARTGGLLKQFETTGPTYGAPSVGRGLILWYPFSGQLRALAIPPP